MSEVARNMVAERGQEDWDSEFQRFPRLFQGHESIPGLTWPTTTFTGKMSVFLGKRRVDILQLGRAHTAGDAVIHVPDANVMFTGDIVEAHSACYCGDGHFADWGTTLEAVRAFDLAAIAPGRGGAVLGRSAVNAALDRTKDFVESTYRPVARIAARGGSLKEAWNACRADCDPKFKDYAIYEHWFGHCAGFGTTRRPGFGVGRSRRGRAWQPCPVFCQTHVRDLRPNGRRRPYARQRRALEPWQGLLR
jgi:glyoxylase-like metal-dependent hydrolase (beta-lactamase superfamily II)